MSRKLFILIFVPLLVGAVSFRTHTRAQTAAAASESGLDLAALNKSVDACTDFYQFACGGWLKNNPLPGDRPRYGRFDELQERNNLILREILEAAAKSRATGEDRKIGDYYASCMNEKAIDAKGLAPLEGELDRIAALSRSAELPTLLASLHEKGVGAFFNFGSIPDFKNASAVIAGVGMGGLGLPDRDYYFKEDANSQKLRDGYGKHVARMFELTGDNAEKAAAGAKTVMRIETALAKATLDRVARRTPAKIYHPMKVPELAALTPAFDWGAYIKAQQPPPFETINVDHPDFFKAFNAVLTSSPVEDLRTYLRWHILHASAALLPTPFVNEDFAFYGAMLQGAKEQRPRWKRCTDYTNQDLGEILGKAYVAKTFGEEGKERTLAMVHAIEAALEKDIREIAWMSDQTKKEALAKLKAIANKIGYPDDWRDYSPLRVVPGDALGNSQRANVFEFERQLSKIGKPVDKTEWFMTPPTVNAYYNPLENNINFPAGILQPPFFNKAADDAVNLGAVGAVVGHELTHGFDDQGRQFDPQGNLRDWWTPEDGKAFEARAACIANQYGGYTAVGDVKLSGKLTLGENVADNGGLRLAWMALQDLMAKEPLTKADGFTPEQRFFLGWAQMWCENKTDEFARLHAQTNVHSPGRYRTNGVVANFPEFAKAFGCSAGSPMVNATACRVW